MRVVHRWLIAGLLLAGGLDLPVTHGGEPTPARIQFAQAPDSPVPLTPAPELPPAPAPAPEPEMTPLPQPTTVAPVPFAANCNCLPAHWCVKAPYTCKSAPCPPSPCYAKSCETYCPKSICLPVVCQQWCKDCYNPKPPVCCFPGDPCPPCAPGKHHGKR